MLKGELIDYLREFNMVSMILRFFLALILGGLIGMEREKKNRPAGFRTYMLVCLGSALTMVLSQYIASIESYNLSLRSINTDATRLGAQVVSGIGFLGAGTIIVTGKQDIKGLTTAAGIWSSACMGLATGAGFYECTILGFIFILLSVRVFPIIERFVVEHSKNMMIYVEFEAISDISEIVQSIKGLGIKIYDVSMDKNFEKGLGMFYAIITIRLPEKMAHTEVLIEMSKVGSIYFVEEL